MLRHSMSSRVDSSGKARSSPETWFPDARWQVRARELQTARRAPPRREARPETGRERSAAPRFRLRSPGSARRSVCGPVSTSEMIPRLADHDDAGFGSARHALSFLLAVGPAFLLAPRVSSAAGERSRERHRGRARLALPSSRRRAFRKRAFLRSRRDLGDRDGFPKGRKASSTPANAPPSARCLALRRSRGREARPGADFGSEPGLAGRTLRLYDGAGTAGLAVVGWARPVLGGTSGMISCTWASVMPWFFMSRSEEPLPSPCPFRLPPASVSSVPPCSFSGPHRRCKTPGE